MSTTLEISLPLRGSLAPAKSVMVVESTSKSTANLLTLPAEIRNTVYTLLLTSPILYALRRLVGLNHCSSYVLPPVPLHVSLLSTCKQIYTEASPILYAFNTFSASPTLLTKLPYLINPTRPICHTPTIKRIKKWYIKVRIDCDPRFTLQDVTEAFSGCEELEVEAIQAMYQSAGTGVLMLFKAVRGVGRAKVTGSVEADFAAWLEGAMMSTVGEDVEDFHNGHETRVVDGVVEKYDPWRHGNR